MTLTQELSKTPPQLRQDARTDVFAEKTAIAAHLARISELTALVADAKKMLMSGLVDAASIGHQLGSALNTAKAQLDQQTFGLLLEQAALTKPEADRWMQFELQFEPPTKDTPLSLRQATLALGLLPAKPEIEHAGDMTVSVPRIKTAELVLVFGRIKRQLALGVATLDPTEFKNDTAELRDFLNEYFANN